MSLANNPSSKAVRTKAVMRSLESFLQGSKEPQAKILLRELRRLGLEPDAAAFWPGPGASSVVTSDGWTLRVLRHEPGEWGWTATKMGEAPSPAEARAAAEAAVGIGMGIEVSL